MSDKTLNKFITSNRLTILKLLAEYRFLTTNQLWQLVGHKRVQRTREDLDWLKKQELILGFRYEPERGTASELCWLLLLNGARQLKAQTGLELNYGNHFRRQPDRERIYFREVELAFEKQVRTANWKLIRPITYSRYKPLPVKTEQYHILVHILTLEEQKRVAIGTIINPNGRHTLCVPLRTNDYVAYTEDKTRAVIFILQPPRATQKFWETRITDYKLLAKELKVIGVFEKEPEAIAHKTLLEKEKFLITTVDRVGKGLFNLAK
jgi:hypothetical protein